jgi:hypothetical protein
MTGVVYRTAERDGSTKWMAAFKCDPQHCFAGKHSATDSITCGRDLSFAEINRTGLHVLESEMANDGSVAYARMAH